MSRRGAHLCALCGGRRLELAPPFDDRRIGHPELGAQLQQVEGRPQARVFQGAKGTPATRRFEARLHEEHLSYAEHETTRDGDPLADRPRDIVERIEDGAGVVPHPARGLLDAQADRAVHEEREQEHRRHGAIGADACVGVGEAAQQHLFRRTSGVLTGELGDIRQQHLEQAVRTQHFIAAHTVTGEEQLQRLVEETGGWDAAEQFAQPLDRLSGRRVEGEAELRLETRRT